LIDGPPMSDLPNSNKKRQVRHSRMRDHRWKGRKKHMPNRPCVATCKMSNDNRRSASDFSDSV
jgi:hypothetical protein